MPQESPSALAERDAEKREVPVPEDPPTPKADAVRQVVEAKDPKSLDPEVVQDATDWFLADDDDEIAEHTFEINVGVNKPRWVRWTVRAIDRDRIRELRNSTMNRQQRRGGQQADDMRVNLLIATEGSVMDWSDPRVMSYKKQDGTPGTFVDPSDALRYRFRRKPGLIDQIAGEVLSTSGYDDEDVREIAAAKSAGTSGP